MLFYYPYFTNNNLTLTPEESGHIVRVLRLKTGDTINITDGKGQIALAKIADPDMRKCGVEIIEKTLSPLIPIPLHIAVSPTKNIDRVLWFVEKAVEIGIQKISFPICKHSERKTLNIEKVMFKAISAMKQSKGAYLPEINEPISFIDFVKTGCSEKDKFIAHLEDENTPELLSMTVKNNSSLILIGPEGDFSDPELELAKKAGFTMVRIGNKRLRTETAALHACSLINGIHYS